MSSILPLTILFKAIHYKFVAVDALSTLPWRLIEHGNGQRDRKVWVFEKHIKINLIHQREGGGVN